MKRLLLLVVLLLALPFCLQAGYGFYHGYDVKNGLITLILGLIRHDLVFALEEVHPEALADFKPRPVTWKGELESEALVEASGLAASQTQEGLFFSVNDSGNEPRLFALDEQGGDKGSWLLSYNDFHDFEDMAAFHHEGKRYLLVADTGDNFNWRPRLTILIFEEPNSAVSSGTLAPAWSFQYSYPEGYRDCEAVAVDERGGRIYLISKRRV
ncbi:MAG: hypothetical protein HOE54_09795, partial [Gammaproteobacteria bacterium]|nr:hypothetical protein [Gammaproteobacteria bacterium]